MLCDEGEKPPSIAISNASVLMLILTRAISARYSAKVQVKATIGSFLSACQSKALRAVFNLVNGLVSKLWAVEMTVRHSYLHSRSSRLPPPHFIPWTSYEEAATKCVLVNTNSRTPVAQLTTLLQQR
jgi:hypothetical protein